jgi:cytochrome P450
LWRLANDPALRRHLIANPDKIPMAVDELLRYYTPALIGRLALRDVQVNDVTIKAGQQVMLWLPVANRDRRVFPDADTFIADRTPNRHLGLGNGIHRCLGAHLIRVEGHVTFREFLKRIPDFEIDPDKPIKWQAGQVSGVSELNVVFEPGTRLG